MSMLFNRGWQHLILEFYIYIFPFPTEGNVVHKNLSSTEALEDF